MCHLVWTPLWRCVLVTTGRTPTPGSQVCCECRWPCAGHRRSSRAYVFSHLRAVEAPLLDFPSMWMSPGPSPGRGRGNRHVKDELIFPSPLHGWSYQLRRTSQQGLAGRESSGYCWKPRQVTLCPRRLGRVRRGDRASDLVAQAELTPMTP